MVENIENQPWTDSPWVVTFTDYTDTDDSDIDLSRIAWFDVNMDLADTEVEKKERIEAIHEQIQLGILQPNGYPTGMKVPDNVSLVKPNNRPFKEFNFPKSIGTSIPAKFRNTPVTKHLLDAEKGLQPTPKGIDMSIFTRGDEKLRKSQELNRRK
jgi:hypothetical protein